MSLMTIIAFVLILSILIFVHELGHFVVAKRSGITVEEFAIGFPPRAVKLWQDEGRITLNGQDYLIGRKFNLSRAIQPGVQVYAGTTIDEKGRPALASIELVSSSKEESKNSQPVDSEARLFNLLSFGSKRTAPYSTSTQDGRPIFTVDNL